MENGKMKKNPIETLTSIPLKGAIWYIYESFEVRVFPYGDIFSWGREVGW